MTQAEFHNGLRILRSIDAHELDDPSWWPVFRDDPFHFFIRCDDETAAKIWAVVEKRAKPRVTALFGVFEPGLPEVSRASHYS